MIILGFLFNLDNFLPYISYNVLVHTSVGMMLFVPTTILETIGMSSPILLDITYYRFHRGTMAMTNLTISKLKVHNFIL